jgi:hypothetical protein
MDQTTPVESRGDDRQAGGIGVAKGGHGREARDLGADGRLGPIGVVPCLAAENSAGTDGCLLRGSPASSRARRSSASREGRIRCRREERRFGDIAHPLVRGPFKEASCVMMISLGFSGRLTPNRLGLALADDDDLESGSSNLTNEETQGIALFLGRARCPCSCGNGNISRESTSSHSEEKQAVRLRLALQATVVLPVPSNGQRPQRDQAQRRRARLGNGLELDGADESVPVAVDTGREVDLLRAPRARAVADRQGP